MLQKLKSKAKEIKAELSALYLAYKHPEVPWYAKLFTALVIGYALSPIDLIPDFIPVLGYLDDIILIPLGIAMALKMIPTEIMAECRMQAKVMEKNSPGKSWIAAVVILLVWVLLVWIIVRNFIK